MNCVYCGLPTPPAPRDESGVALMPEAVHLDCIERHYEALGSQRGFGVVPLGSTASFRKFAPLTTMTKEQPTDAQE